MTTGPFELQIQAFADKLGARVDDTMRKVGFGMLMSVSHAVATWLASEDGQPFAAKRPAPSDGMWSERIRALKATVYH